MLQDMYEKLGNLADSFLSFGAFKCDAFFIGISFRRKRSQSVFLKNIIKNQSHQKKESYNIKFKHILIPRCKGTPTPHGAKSVLNTWPHVSAVLGTVDERVCYFEHGAVTGHVGGGYHGFA